MVRPTTTVALAVALAAGWLSACSRAEEQSRDHSAGPVLDRPDLLLISLDTLRADLLDARRPDGTPEMPHLAAFAAQAVRFPDAWAPMAFTLPSHMTMFTGVHPETHYVTTEQDVLSDELETLPEVLQRAGYATAGFYSNSWLKSGFGFERGFEVYEAISPGLAVADEVFRRVEEQLERARREQRPAFVFAHVIDAHSDADVDGNRLSYYSDPVFRDDLEVPEGSLCDLQQRCATDLLLWADREERQVADEDRALHRELYRRGARQLDTALGTLLGRLEATGFLDRGVVAIVSDHGEEFREHGRFLHSQVYVESLRIPLLIRLPGSTKSGTIDPRWVGLEDLAPTLAALAAVPAPAAHQGFDLFVPSAAGRREVVLGQDKLRRTRFGLRMDARLLIWDFADATLQLFDLAADPDETVDLAAERPTEAAQLRRRLIAELRRLRSERPTLRRSAGELFGPREREALRSLGYL